MPDHKHLWVKQGTISDQPLLVVLCLKCLWTVICPCNGPYPEP
jgi:hypothetical protein